jgi:hypothetical protein
MPCSETSRSVIESRRAAMSQCVPPGRLCYSRNMRLSCCLRPGPTERRQSSTDSTSCLESVCRAWTRAAICCTQSTTARDLTFVSCPAGSVDHQEVVQYGALRHECKALGQECRTRASSCCEHGRPSQQSQAADKHAIPLVTHAGRMGRIGMLLTSHDISSLRFRSEAVRTALA